MSGRSTFTRLTSGRVTRWSLSYRQPGIPSCGATRLECGPTMVDDGVYEFGKSLSNTTAETLDAQQNHATALVFWQDRKPDVTILRLSRLLSECLGHHL